MDRLILDRKRIVAMTTPTPTATSGLMQTVMTATRSTTRKSTSIAVFLVITPGPFSRNDANNFLVSSIVQTSNINNPAYAITAPTTVSGIFPTRGPSAVITTSRIRLNIIPESLVLPPALKLATALYAAPHDDMAPKSDAAILPAPWPISSLLLLYRIPVKLTVITESRRVSIEPTNATTRAVTSRSGMSF